MSVVRLLYNNLPKTCIQRDILVGITSTVFKNCKFSLLKSAAAFNQEEFVNHVNGLS